jgi:hypothetical protein
MVAAGRVVDSVRVVVVVSSGVGNGVAVGVL